MIEKEMTEVLMEDLWNLEFNIFFKVTIKGFLPLLPMTDLGNWHISWQFNV